MNNHEKTPFADANLRRAYLEGVAGVERSYVSPPMVAAYDLGRYERERLQREARPDDDA